MTETPVVLQENKVYIVVTQTGTILSRLLKIITGAPYNHVSVTLDSTLNTMYSFGRKNPYNPFWGGFVVESPRFGTFKRFSETEAVVLCVDITESQKQRIGETLSDMYENRNRYHYNTLGLLLASVRIRYRRENRYYCSEFVKALLTDFGVVDPAAIGDIPKPVEFLKIQEGTILFCGKLRSYSQRSE